MDAVIALFRRVILFASGSLINDNVCESFQLAGFKFPPFLLVPACVVWGSRVPRRPREI
jgi:hypothetical protein